MACSTEVSRHGRTGMCSQLVCTKKCAYNFSLRAHCWAWLQAYLTFLIKVHDRRRMRSQLVLVSTLTGAPTDLTHTLLKDPRWADNALTTTCVYEHIARPPKGSQRPYNAGTTYLRECIARRRQTYLLCRMKVSDGPRMHDYGAKLLTRKGSSLRT